MAGLEGVLLYLYYAFFVLGSASFGYLVLRLGYPDVRLYGGKEKLGLSGIIGGAIALLALGLDFAASKVAAYDFSAGFLPVFLIVVVSLFFLGLRLYFFYFSRPDYITVGIPIPAVPLPARVAEQLVTRVPPVHVPVLENAVERIEAKPLQAAAPVLPSAPAPKAEPVKAPQVQPSFFGFPAKQPAAPQAQQAKPREEDRLQRLMDAMKKGEAPAKPVALPSKEAVLPAKPAEVQKPIEAPKPAPFAPPWVKKPAEVSMPAKPKEEAKPAFAGVIPPVPIKPKPSVAPQVQPTTPLVSPAGRAVAREVEIIIPLKETEAAKPQPVPWLAGKKPVPSAAEISLARKEAAPIERLKELKREVNTGEAEQMIEIDVPLKKAGSAGAVAMQSVPAAKEEVKAELKKVREAEFEAVARDLGIIKEGEPATQARPAPEGERMRRRYLARGEQSSVKVIASKSVAEKEEFGDLVQDVYSQLKATSTEESLQSAMQVGKPQVKKPSEITMEDLFGEQKKPEEKEGARQLFGAPPEEAPSSLFAQLNAISAGTPAAPAAAAEEKEKKSSVEFVKIQAEKGMGCPTCHSKNTRIVFCPYCGTGMCANCSPKITPKQDSFIYVCPKCLEDVNVKKKSPTTPQAQPHKPVPA